MLDTMLALLIGSILVVLMTVFAPFLFAAIMMLFVGVVYLLGIVLYCIAVPLIVIWIGIEEMVNWIRSKK